MSTRMHSSIALLGIVLAGAWTAACGGGTATEMVSSPEVAVGAAIQGKVSVASGSGGQAFGFEAGLASSAVRVSVVGTDRSTTTDTQGRFALTGLSAGQVTLRFQATGVDARLSLGGLVEGQAQPRTGRDRELSVNHRERLREDAPRQELRSVQGGGVLQVIRTVQRQGRGQRQVRVGQPAPQEHQASVAEQLDLPPGFGQSTAAGGLCANRDRTSEDAERTASCAVEGAATSPGACGAAGPGSAGREPGASA